jgi:hypothetical protein
MPWILSNSTYTVLVVVWLVVTGGYSWLVEYGLLDVYFFCYVFWVSIFPCLSLMLSKVVFSVFLKIILCILLGCRFKVFLYLEISFLQLIVVSFVIMSSAFFLAVLPMVPSVLIQSLVSIGSFGGIGMFACG